MVYCGLVLITIFLQPLLLDIGVQANSGRTNRQKDRQPEKQTDKWTDRRTDRKSEEHLVLELTI